VQTQLLEVVREVASNDFPTPWSNILPECLASLAGAEPARLYGSLLVLRKVAASVEFASRHSKAMQVCHCAWYPTCMFLTSAHCADMSRSICVRKRSSLLLVASDCATYCRSLPLLHCRR
jgi:hypothetical protein